MVITPRARYGYRRKSQAAEADIAFSVLRGANNAPRPIRNENAEGLVKTVEVTAYVAEGYIAARGIFLSILIARVPRF